MLSSRRMRHCAGSGAVPHPATIIPTGIPRPQMLTRTQARDDLGISAAARVMLYVGRLAPEKNLDLLTKAASIVIKRDPSVRLIMVGDGPLRPHVTRLIRDLGIGDQVTLTGAVPRHAVDPYYAAADIFIFASITETQGLVLQEAMSYGLPPIAVVGGGASQAIRDGVDGLIAANDAEELARLARALLSDDARRLELATRAMESRSSNGIRAMTESMLQVYRRAREGAELLAPPSIRAYH
ncbi:MAG: hypothetical protein C4320_08330 [Armatimonadota bacterium]